MIATGEQKIFTDCPLFLEGENFAKIWSQLRKLVTLSQTVRIADPDVIENSDEDIVQQQQHVEPVQKEDEKVDVD